MNTMHRKCRVKEKCEKIRELWILYIFPVIVLLPL